MVKEKASLGSSSPVTALDPTAIKAWRLMCSTPAKFLAIEVLLPKKLRVSCCPGWSVARFTFLHDRSRYFILLQNTLKHELSLFLDVFIADLPEEVVALHWLPRCSIRVATLPHRPSNLPVSKSKKHQTHPQRRRKTHNQRVAKTILHPPEKG